MGHASSATTEHFYLKENAAEVASRAKIPWFNGNEEKKKIVPSFLAEADKQNTKKVRQATKQKRQRRKMLFKKFDEDGSALASIPEGSD